MKIVLQRSKAASVTVDGEVTGKIDHGLVLLVGVSEEDTEESCNWLAEKIAHVRIFEGEDGKMNESVLDKQGAILSISQFTLYGDCSKGRRPNFMKAARPDKAEQLYNYFNQQLKAKGLHVETGVFGAMMDVQLINDGPVTLILEK